MAWDSIAREYATDFDITCTGGGPVLAKFVRETRDPEASIVQTYLMILSRIPDSLIARKCGSQEARRVSRQAGAILAEGGRLLRKGGEGSQAGIARCGNRGTGSTRGRQRTSPPQRSLR